MQIVAALIEHPLIAASAALLLLYVISTIATRSPKLPENLPWIGKDASRASMFSNGRKWLAEGYRNFSKQARTWIYSDISGVKHIMLPNEEAHWVLDHPDNELSVGAAHYDMLAGDYAFTDPSVLGLLYHEHVIHRNIARKLKDIIPDMWEEVEACFDDIWGTDTKDWKEITVYESTSAMVLRISNRMLVGLPLCRNQDFLNTVASFASDVVNCVVANQITPKFLRPLVMPIVSLANRYHYSKMRSHILPVIEKRIADVGEKERNPDAKIDIPEDYFIWHIRLARAEGKTYEATADFISRAILGIEFAAWHTTTISGTNATLDLLSSDPQRGFIDGVREEVERIYREEGGLKTKQALNKLVRTDSALRESMRVLEMVPLVSRKVVKPDGVSNLEQGWTAPYGSFLSIPVTNRHYDEDVYPNPDTYDAFRFSRPREAYEASNPDEKQTAEYLKLQNTSFTSTSENFLPFGHGRHACPGRFFVQQELKMIFAYMVLNYDIEQLEERPKARHFGTTPIPPTNAVVRIRRKAGTVKN